jgi:hypothetical protein
MINLPCFRAISNASLCTMPTKDRDRPKICHCTPNCNCLLSLRQRKYHYHLVHNPSTIRHSTTPSDNSGNDHFSDNDQSNSSNDGSVKAMDISDGHGDIDMAGDSDDLEEQRSIQMSDHDPGQEAGNGFFDWSDEEDWEFHQEDEFLEQSLSLDEVEEALEDVIGPGKDLEIWNLRKMKIIQIFNFLIVCLCRQLHNYRTGSD